LVNEISEIKQKKLIHRKDTEFIENVSFPESVLSGQQLNTSLSSDKKQAILPIKYTIFRENIG